MRKLLGVTLLVVGGLLPAVTSSSQNSVLNPRLGRARNVAIGFEVGADFVQNPPTDEDREALYAIRQEIERSKRFWIVNRGAADLLIAIRVRGVTAGRGNNARIVDGLRFRGGDNRADILSVYDAHSPKLLVPLWRGTRIDGLSGDRPSLFASFQSDVEKVAKKR
ncbi:MAG: hypothetical protein ABI672_02985 [Vicinamibacteria bacterium]